jgi:hypothetical protein
MSTAKHREQDENSSAPRWKEHRKEEHETDEGSQLIEKFLNDKASADTAV